MTGCLVRKLRFLFECSSDHTQERGNYANDVSLGWRRQFYAGLPLFCRRNCSIFEEITMCVFPTPCYFPAEVKKKKKKKEEAAKNRVDSLLLTALTQSSDAASCILYSSVRQCREGPPPQGRRWI